MNNLRLQPVGKWQPLLRPSKYCQYINDHTIFKDKDGKWRLIGTCANSDYAFYRERFFVQGVTSELSKEMIEAGVLFEKTPHRWMKMAPTVFFNSKDRKYHLFFASPFVIHHYVSQDGKSWKNTVDAVRSFWPAVRDPHIIQVASQFIMYLTDFGNKISAYSSKDLSEWKKEGAVLRLGRGMPKSLNSSCESSCVFDWQDGHILLTTIVPSPRGRRANYTHTIAFYSQNPFDFGVYSPDKRNTAKAFAHLDTHAPEIIRDRNKLYLSTCGWKGFPKPGGVSGEGVFIRRVKIGKDRESGGRFCEKKT